MLETGANVQQARLPVLNLRPLAKSGKAKVIKKMEDEAPHHLVSLLCILLSLVPYMLQG